MQKAIKIMCVTSTIQQKRKNNKVGIEVFRCILKNCKAAKSSAEFREGQGFVVMSVIN